VIDKATLTTAEHRERGRIKSIGDRFIYVVFRCNERCGDYRDYTAAPCLPQYLYFEQEEPVTP
jgi:hypothetical protein